MLTVLPAAGLPCAARAKVALANSLQGLQPLRSNNASEFEHEAHCVRPPRHCAARRHQGAPPHATSAFDRPACVTPRVLVRRRDG
ncbi:MAG: hypothetical protein ACT4O7_03730 [Aquabacterium sp.]